MTISYRKIKFLRDFIFAIVVASSSSLSNGQETTSSTQELNSLFSSYSHDTAPYFPFTASDNGVHKYDSVFANDLTEEYRSGLKALCTKYLSDLQAIVTSGLSRQEKLSYDIFQYRLNTCIEGFNYKWYLMPINQAGSSWPTSFPVIGSGKGSHPFKTVRNYEDFLSRIDGFVVWIDSAIVNMRSGIEQGYTQPRDVMLKVLPQLDAQIVERPEMSSFYEPVTKFPATFDDESKSVLTEKYRSTIQKKIIPAYRKLRTFINDEYIPKCRTTAGLGSLPSGKEMYLQAVRNATTTNMTPNEIYELGVLEVNRVSTEIKTLKSEMNASHQEIGVEYESVDGILAGYRELRTAVEKLLPQYFGRVPKTDFEIRPIEPYREKSMSSSYIFSSLDGSRPGVFYLNTSALKSSGHMSVSRSLFLHEAIPGHHLQTVLQRENKNLPLFRRLAWYSAFGEGWALYCEGLGNELGLYSNTLDRLKMLNDELFRSARLVADVGLHEKGWSRDQGIEYLKKSGGQSDESAEREIERYMAWPGQALSYKIGQLKILSIRKKAEVKFGSAFDVRAFHDELLKDGGMPLNLLEMKMDQWMTSQK